MIILRMSELSLRNTSLVEKNNMSSNSIDTQLNDIRDRINALKRFEKEIKSVRKKKVFLSIINDIIGAENNSGLIEIVSMLYNNEIKKHEEKN